MSEDNQQVRRITLEFLREEVLSRRWRGCALHSWMRKGYQN
jgi:hypothetical protein